ncbi:unnamed protein product [Symbiodinium natans]|uniref:Uncharacterized protein n=1 Tax=Symbiodinium natans TaxID=878477 RepID=A0A812RUG8_9DINO|nr:unnamed protein product [Symbiodinium natans]
MTLTEPAMPVTTIEVPAHADKRFYEGVLELLAVSSGMIIFRFLGQLVWDKDFYVQGQEIFAEICEVIDSRPTYIVNVAKGDVRSLPVAFAALSDVSLAESDATFGFPEVRVGGMPACVTVAMRKRVSDDYIRKMITDGLPIDAREAQRVGLVDFVGDVETESPREFSCKQSQVHLPLRIILRTEWMLLQRLLRLRCHRHLRRELTTATTVVLNWPMVLTHDGLIRWQRKRA